VLQNTGLRELRTLSQNMATLITSALNNEDDEQYQTFLNEQLDTLNKALRDSETPDEYKVAIVGSFKVGKSSFVNALCDVKGLASVNTNPETAAITVFRYADTAFAKVHMTDREEWEEMAAPFNDNPSFTDDTRYGAILKLEQSGKLKEDYSTSLAELEKKYISSPGMVERIECADWTNSKARSEFNKQIKGYMSRRNPVHHLVDRLEVYVPVPLLKDGIELVDTPGLNDTDRYRVRLTEELVEDVDVILYLTQSGAAYSQSDKEFITTQLRKGKIKHLLVIVTKCDVTFESALQDAEDNDEEPITFQQHLEIEEERIREQIKNTLDELLDAVKGTKFTDDQGYFFIEQLDEIKISFISSHYYRDKKPEAGIDQLRTELAQMLTESERIFEAKQILSKSFQIVHEQVTRNFKTRLDVATKDFDKERVREQLEHISLSLNGKLDSFRQIAEEQAQLLMEQNESDWELITSNIEIMLYQTENVITTEFEMSDIAKHWKTRRYHGWGYLSDMQNKIANRVFIPMSSNLEKYTNRFKEILGRIRENLDRLQKTVVEIEQGNSLDGAIQPLNLTEIFDLKYQSHVADLSNFTISQKQRIISHLDDFISDEVKGEIYEARDEVSDIWGRGTTWRQNERVMEFYSYLKLAVKRELRRFLTSETRNFASTLEKKVELVYPDFKDELDIIMGDHLKAIETNLVELNEYQKGKLVDHLKNVLNGFEEAKKTYSDIEKSYNSN